MSANRKYYVVWEGLAPGIYDSWVECQLQTKGYPGARYKAFDTLESATAAFRGNPADHIGLLKSIAKHTPAIVNYETIPEIRLDAIAVDGACSKNPGPMEYRCVTVKDKRELFRMGPLQGGTNNIGEYLALVHALAMLDKAHNTTTPVYTDSRNALAWLRNKKHKSSIIPNDSNARIIDLLNRADAWLQAHPNIPNPVLKWETEKWGEIPADFGRKK